MNKKIVPKLINLIELFISKKISGRNYSSKFLTLRRSEDSLPWINSRLDKIYELLFTDVEDYEPDDILRKSTNNNSRDIQYIDDKELRKRTKRNLAILKNLLNPKYEIKYKLLTGILSRVEERYYKKENIHDFLCIFSINKIKIALDNNQLHAKGEEVGKILKIKITVTSPKIKKINTKSKKISVLPNQVLSKFPACKVVYRGLVKRKFKDISTLDGLVLDVGAGEILILYDRCPLIVFGKHPKLPSIRKGDYIMVKGISQLDGIIQQN